MAGSFFTGRRWLWRAKKKSKERGQAIVDTVKGAEKNINDAVLKMQENLPQLEEEEEVEADN